MKCSIFWSKSVQFDLENIIEYIAVKSVSSAQKLFAGIKIRCVGLTKTPKMGRIIPELQQQNIKTYRELIVLHWRIMYKIDKRRVAILAVLDSRRDIDDALLNRSLGR